MKEVIVSQFEVKLNQQTNPIMEAFNAALRATGLQAEPTDVGTTNLASGKKRSCDSMLGAVVETLVGVPFGRNKNIFDAQVLSLEVNEAHLLKQYQSFLMQMLVAQNVSPAQSEQTLIDSKYVLAQKLLSRLATFALDRRYGEKYLSVLKDFVNKLREQGILVETSYFGLRANSSFLTLLATQHEGWIKDIESVIALGKLYDKNSQSIADTSKTLESIKQTAQRQLIAYLDPKCKDGFSTEWLENTLDKKEKEIIRVYKILNQIEETSTNYATKETRDLVKKALIENNNKDLEKISALYAILDRNDIVQSVLDEIDKLVKDTGWLPVLSGVIKLDALSKLFRDYSKQCNDALKIEDKIMQSPAGVNLLKFNASNAGLLTFNFIDNINNLVLLENSAVKDFMVSRISGVIVGLANIQSQLPLEYHFINVGRILGQANTSNNNNNSVPGSVVLSIEDVVNPSPVFVTSAINGNNNINTVIEMANGHGTDTAEPIRRADANITY